MQNDPINLVDPSGLKMVLNPREYPSIGSFNFGNIYAGPYDAIGGYFNPIFGGPGEGAPGDYSPIDRELPPGIDPVDPQNPAPPRGRDFLCPPTFQDFYKNKHESNSEWKR